MDLTVIDNNYIGSKDPIKALANNLKMAISQDSMVGKLGNNDDSFRATTMLNDIEKRKIKFALFVFTYRFKEDVEDIKDKISSIYNEAVSLVNRQGGDILLSGNFKRTSEWNFDAVLVFQLPEQDSFQALLFDPQMMSEKVTMYLSMIEESHSFISQNK